MKKNAIILFFLCIGCINSLHNSIIETNKSQLEIRSYQTHTFEEENLNFVMTNIISTMQDLGFILDRVDNNLSIVSGTSFKNGSKLTVSARQNNKDIIVRVNAQTDTGSITNPIPYQNFFNALSQSIFLNKNI